MNFSAIVLLLIALSIFCLAWFKFKKGNIKIAIASLVIAGFLLRCFMISDPYLHEWDERYHALVAKNMIDDPFKPTLYKNPVLPFDYKDWGGNHVWVHKQPVPLWLMAISLKIFGIHEIAVRIPSLLASTLGIFLMYLIGRNLFDKKVGFFSAFLFSIHGLILELTGGRVATDHIDLLFMFFVLLGIYFSIEFAKSKKLIHTIFCGMAIGLAVLTKWLPGLIVLAFYFLILQRNVFQRFSKKEIFLNVGILMLISCIIFMPWQIYIHHAFPLESTWEKHHNRLHIFQNLDGQAAPFYYHINHMRIIYGELIYLPLLWFIYKTLKKKWNFKYLAILTWLVIPYIFFSLVATKMQGYTLISGPAIFLVSALFWRVLRVYKARFKYKIIPLLLIVCLIFLPIRYTIERVKILEDYPKERQYTNKIKALKKLKIDANTIIFNAPRPIETMFYIDCIAYSHLPDNKEITKLKERGFKVIIY